MEPTLTDFIARFPEFPEAVVNTYLPPLLATWKCYYGGNYGNPCDREITLQLLAHLLTIDSKSTKPGPNQLVQSRGAGALSVSYAQPGAPRSELALFFGTSRYGQRYWWLTNSSVGAVFV